VIDPMGAPMGAPQLVIGIGNTLRGDDAVGWLLAEQARGWKRPGLEVSAVQQLTPELAPRLAAAGEVLFIDACFADAAAPGPSLLPLAPGALASGTPRLSHHTTPEALLALAERLYGRRPAAWCLRIPAHDDRLGTQLSAATAAQLGPARRALHRWLDRHA
jgi:hydrogenase maturation protease